MYNSLCIHRFSNKTFFTENIFNSSKSHNVSLKGLIIFCKNIFGQITVPTKYFRDLTFLII